ncbi:hypothetical protein [Streptomyces phaeochromogenes]
MRDPVCSVVEARWEVAARLVQTVDQPVDPLGFLGELRDVARDGP